MRVIKFIGFKIAEVVAYLLFAHLCYLYLSPNIIKDGDVYYTWSIVIQYFLSSLIGLCILMLLSSVMFLLWLLIKKNWEWANK